MLQRIGRALERIGGPDALVARLHGDVFALAVPPGQASSELGDEILQIVRGLGRDEPDVELAASIGLRPIGSPGDDPATWIDEAREAAADVKRAGGNGVCVADAELRAAMLEEVTLRHDLQGALDRNELVVEYQPVVGLPDGVVRGAEALLRWDHPTQGRIGPDVFIPLAEQTGIISSIGRHVISEACRSAARWRTRRPEVPLRVGVNLSPAQLVDPTLPDHLRAELDRWALDPSLLILEVTESMLMERNCEAAALLAQLKAVGVRIGVDDFGTGYSSLARLKELPIDVLKVDRSFTAALGSCPEDSSIVTTVLALAEALGLDVTVEGVEHESQRDALVRLGCDRGQGFLWSGAVSAERFDALLDRGYPAAPVVSERIVERTRTEGYADALRVLHHELAAPLSVLSTLVDGFARLGDDERDALVSPLTRSVRRIEHVMESLALLDRLDRGTLAVQRREHVDLLELVGRVAEDTGARLDRTIDVVADGPCIADLDAPLVEQVLVNLMTNAVEYSPPETPVRVEVSQKPGSVVVSVTDDGPGLSPEQLGTAWRKFGRLDHRIPGSGIGLYLARGIARAHGGELRYWRAPAGGSVFTLDLPTP